jgi:hypothetical protein
MRPSLACAMQRRGTMDSFDPGDGAATLPIVARTVRWLRLILKLASLMVAVLVMAYVLFGFIGIRARTHARGY